MSLQGRLPNDERSFNPQTYEFNVPAYFRSGKIGVHYIVYCEVIIAGGRRSGSRRSSAQDGFLTAREKRRVGRQICANVFVNKGEGSVKGKGFLPAA